MHEGNVAGVRCLVPAQIVYEIEGEQDRLVAATIDWANQLIYTPEGKAWEDEDCKKVFEFILTTTVLPEDAFAHSSGREDAELANTKIEEIGERTN